MARIRDILGGLTCAAGVAAVLIAIMGTVSAHGTQAVSAVAASESAAANQAAARADAAALLDELSLPAGATESSSEPAGDEGLLVRSTGLRADTSVCSGPAQSVTSSEMREQRRSHREPGLLADASVLGAWPKEPLARHLGHRIPLLASRDFCEGPIRS